MITPRRTEQGIAVRWFRDAFGACALFEWLTLGYLGFLSLLILLFRRNVPGAPGFVLLHCGIALAFLALVSAAQRRPHPVFAFLRRWYPLALFLFFFEELHYVVHAVHAGWFDRWLIQFDYALFGVHPTVWFARFASRTLSEVMQFSYMTYYLYPVILGASLLRGREERAYWRLIAASAAAYYLGYAISILFPVEGPYHTLAALHAPEPAGGAFTKLIGWIESYGRVHGGAFPSAHVSGSFVALLGAWRFRRGTFWIFLPLFSLMLVATVYGRYHYVADILAGLIAGAIGFWLAGAPGLARYLTPAACFLNARKAVMPDASVTSSSMGVRVM